jgi:UDP-2-acetamido-2-deoxy-ribo-hexuluronate aminotransferase
MEFIDLKTQYRQLKNAIDARIHRVLDHGRYIMGPEIEELERRLADRVGVSHCIALASGTDALLVAMMALGVGRGDEVVTSPFTFIATAEMIALLGAVPVFVDVEPLTYNLDPTHLEAALSPRTRAIMPVALFGQCADMDAINTIATHHGLPVIEDAAQSFGATYYGRQSCALSTVGCTSFFPSKPLGCYGDGGACFTDDGDLAESMRVIRVHGQDRRYHHPVLGLNARMDTLQAAVLLAKLDTFADEVAARESIGARYSELISARGLSARTPYVAAHRTCVYAQYTIEVEHRDRVQAALTADGVPTAIHYPLPLHQQPVLANLGHGRSCFPVAERAAQRVLSLPMHPFLDSSTQARVVDALARALC